MTAASCAHRQNTERGGLYGRTVSGCGLEEGGGKREEGGGGDEDERLAVLKPVESERERVWERKRKVRGP